MGTGLTGTWSCGACWAPSGAVNSTPPAANKPTVDNSRRLKVPPLSHDPSRLETRLPHESAESSKHPASRRRTAPNPSRKRCRSGRSLGPRARRGCVQDPVGILVTGLVRADCCQLPFRNAALGWVSIFDAIHLVDIHRFVEEATRVLASGGVLVIYTRTPEQNARSLLGRLFPQFLEKETRLLTENDLRCAVEKGAFRIEAMVPLHHERSASRNDVLAQVRQRPYSTFVFYTDAEWSSAMEKFATHLEQSGSDIISWTDENLLLTCRRTGVLA